MCFNKLNFSKYRIKPLIRNNSKIVKAIDRENIENLKVTVEKEIGYKIRYAKNCDSLSEYIFEKTNYKVSSSTLKRFWEIIKSKYNPSKYTLNTLSVLVGYSSWESFCNKKQERNKIDNFLLLHEKFTNISKANISFIKKQTPVFFYKINKRKFAIKKIETFIKSDKKITNFIANDGFGKSEILARLAEHFFLSENAIYPDTICLFINFKTVNISENKNFDIYNLLKNTLQEKETTKLERKFIEILKGRKLIIFFDRVCKIYKNNSVFPLIIKNLYDIIIGKLSKIDAKIIISCKLNQWSIFEREFSQSEYIKEKWFDFDFNSQYKANIPLLERDEIINAIKSEKKELNYSHILENSKLLEIISIPYFLNMYIFHSSEENKIIDELDLLDFYIKDEILSTIYAEEKLSIIEKILKATNYGRIKKHVKKTDLNFSIPEKRAYNTLLDLNFLSEHITVSDYFEVTAQVSFSNAIIYKFMIINSWLRKSKLNLETIKEILTYYTTEQMKISLLIWLIKIASKKNDFTIFKNIYQVINNHFIKGNPRKLEERQINSLTDTVGLELRKNTDLRNKLLPYYLEQVTSKDLYFRHFFDLDYLVVYYNKILSKFLTTEVNKIDIFFSNTKLFFSLYLSKKITLATKALEIINEISKNSTNLIYTIIYQSCFTIYNYEKQKEIKLDIIIKMFTHFNNFSNYSNKYEQNFTFFMVLEALEVSKNYPLILELINNNKFLRDEDFMKKNNYLLNLINIFKAKALIKENKNKEAFLLLDKINSSKFPEGQKLFWKIKFNIASAQYFEKKGKYEIAKTMRLESLKIAQTLNYEFYIRKCEEKL